MSRMQRIEYTNSFHHIIDRGYLKKQIFLDTNDYKFFLDLLWKVCKSHCLIIHAYCLMPNHFHLLVQNPLQNISKAMHLLLLRYALYFNKKYKQKGKVFERQFLSPLIDTENYLLTVSKYIHRNPLNILVQDLEDWRWSSYKYYINQSLAKPSSLETSLIQKKFFINNFTKSFADYTLESLDWKPEDNIYSNTILGSENFIDQIASSHILSSINTELKDSYKIHKAYNRRLEFIKSHISKLKLDFKTQEALYVYALKSKTSLSYKEISELVFCNSLSRSTLSNKVTKLKIKAKKDLSLAKLMIELDAFI
jgi:putative transposase